MKRKMLWMLIAMAALPRAAEADDRRTKGNGRDAEHAAQTATIETAADAPRPPSDPMKKSQPAELRATPGKKQIGQLETLILQMERSNATIWSFLDDATGTHKREIGYVAGQVTDLATRLADAEKADPAWPKLADYRQRIAYLQKAHEAQKAHYGALATARVDAAKAVETKLDGEWAAKRAVDDGLTTDLHKASVGKILFSTRDTGARENSSAVYTTSASVDAPLFGRAFLAESPWNAMHTANVDCGLAPEKIQKFSVVTHYSVNGGPEVQLEDQFFDKETFRKQTSFSLTGAGSLTAGGDYKNADEQRAPFTWLTGAIGQMKEGDNKVKITMHAWCYRATSSGGQLLASAELTVKATKPGLAAVASRGKFTLGESRWSKGELAKYRAQLTKAYASSDVVDMRTQSDWETRRNERGVILDRFANAIGVLRNKTTPWACTLVSFLIVESYDGQKYGPAFSLQAPNPRPFVCDVK